jgi:hypothetical protein
MKANIYVLISLVLMNSCGHMIGAALRPNNECDGKISQIDLSNYEKSVKFIENPTKCKFIKKFFCSDYTDFSKDKGKGESFFISKNNTLELAHRSNGNSILVLTENTSENPSSLLKSNKTREDQIYTIKGEIYSCPQ